MNDESGRYGVWKCGVCAVEKLGTAHQRRKKYCSKGCYSKDKSLSATGSGNSNYRGGCLKSCFFCGGSYESYKKSRKFCSKKCHVASLNNKPKTPKIKFIKGVAVLRVPKEKPNLRGPRKQREANHKTCAFCNELFKCCKTSSKTTCSPSCSSALKTSRETIKTCAMCGVDYRSSPSQGRKYCSYKCHLDSGGAFKAGMAAAKATMKYGPKRDANHAELFAVLRKHCAVYDVSTSGMGIPDGLAWVNGAWHLFDVKNPKTGYGKRGLNPIQKKWLSQAQGGPIYLLYTAEDAENFATGKFDGLKFEVPEPLDLPKTCG